MREAKGVRVLHINCNYMTTVLHQTMIEHLNEVGVDSQVFAPVYDAKQAVITPHSNVIVSECFKKWDRLHFGYKQKKIIAALEMSADMSRFDCIHAYTLFTDGNCAMRISEKYHIPYVVAVRSTDMNDFLRLKPWLRGRAVEIMEKASAVFFLSERYRTDMFNKHVPEEKKESIYAKTRVIPNGIDDFWLNAVPEKKNAEQMERIRNKQINLIVAGRVNRNKNQLTLAQAVNVLNERGHSARLVVVGKSEDDEVLNQLTRSGFVTYLPSQPKEKLIDQYRQNDIFVLPSYQETFGLVYAEAMSQGLPVLYSKGQGFDGQFPEGEVGYAIDPKSPEDIADKVCAVCDGYEDIHCRVPELARVFNWADIVGTYKEIYSAICG